MSYLRKKLEPLRPAGDPHHPAGRVLAARADGGRPRCPSGPASCSRSGRSRSWRWRSPTWSPTRRCTRHSSTRSSSPSAAERTNCSRRARPKGRGSVPAGPFGGAATVDPDAGPGSAGARRGHAHPELRCPGPRGDRLAGVVATSCPAMRRRPQLHARSSRPPSAGSRRARTAPQVAYLTRPLGREGRPRLRGPGRQVPDETELIVAQPLTDTESTLHHLLWIELGVTAGAVLAALAGGLVAGPARAPAADRPWSATAEYIAAGDLQQRVPGRERQHRGRPAGPDAQRHAGPDRVRLRRPGRLRGAAPGLGPTAPPVRRRRLPRAAHPDRGRLRLRRAVRAGRRGQRGGPRPGDGAGSAPRPARMERPGRRPPDPGPPRRGPAHGAHRRWSW